ncbi:MAG: aldose 1-epimerase family protein [Chloroflexota bacterium]
MTAEGAGPTAGGTAWAGHSAKELRRRVGDLSQLVSTRQIRLADGVEDGVRAIDVRVTGGLSALVLIDRGLDIGPAWAGGHQVSWQSTTGIVAPANLDETQWLRAFHGGLMVTCGLQNVGPACVDGGVAHGIHGRVSHTPARNVTHRVVEDPDGRLVAEVTGDVRETDVYGVDLVLHRTLRFPMGEPLVEIHDVVENLGYAPAGIMVLYHCNLGYPVVADGARLLAPDAVVVPRDPPAAMLLAEHATFPPPDETFDQLVYEHQLRDTAATSAWIGIANPGYAPSGGIAVQVEYDPRQLPHLWQWRMLAPGMYLTGLEPATCGILGRDLEQERGTVVSLAPGERRRHDVTIRVTTGPAVAALVEAYDRSRGGSAA